MTAELAHLALLDNRGLLAEAQAEEAAELGAKVSLFADDGKRKSQSTILVDLCADLELFHDADSTCYGIIKKAMHQEVWPIQSRAFRQWLSRQYFLLTKSGARRNYSRRRWPPSKPSAASGHLRGILRWLGWATGSSWIWLTKNGG